LSRAGPKYAPFGLDLPAERCTYLRPQLGRGPGDSVPLHFAAVMASGISEALDTHRGGGAILMDPPLHYVLVLLSTASLYSTT